MEEELNRWLNSQPYNITVQVQFGTITDSVAVTNELARLDFLEEEIAGMTEYPLAQELIQRITG